ncbi:LruC domain-containing protein [Roseivirga sp.]|uniref:LruC domain-containing protein n=1 Tax=Roseivirga sp. TaxID=1964215 RepID=UPI003B8D4AE9
MSNKLLILLICIAIFSCVEKPEIEIDQVPEQGTDFDFRTTSSTNIELTFQDNTGQPIKGIKANVWSTVNGEKDLLLFTTLTDGQGRANGLLNIPTHISEVVIETSFIGIPNSIHVPILNNTIDMVCTGGKVSTPTIDTYKSSSSRSNGGFSANNGNSVESFTISYMGAYNNQGVPSYLESERDEISSTLLQYINASLPEKQPVPDFHPSYLANGKKTTLDIDEVCDVWLTFVHEGAGWRNAMAFYTYPTNTPPQSLDDIDNVNVIFPNLSFSGSGGGLSSGDKVNIGRFDPGTSVGLVLLANGWDGNNSEDYEHIVFADKNLNPEADDDLKQHNVLLWDADNELFLIGFEDIRRDDIPFKCDQDFNDAILFVTSNPVTAINTDNVSPIDKPGILDTDGDGINDVLDEYPNDPNKAYDSYYPSASTFGTFAFEDNWPNYGDYDFNDLVIDYQFKHTLNADNEIVVMAPKFKIRAIGAGYRNGFGFTTDLLPSDVLSVNGHSVNSNYISLNSNGTESGQSQATFIVSGNVHDHFETNGFVNTEEASLHHEPSEVALEIVFQSPKRYADIGSVPYNPFLIISQNRGREVHLPGYAPTDLVDASLFGTQDDDSDISIGQYYRSKTDLPWGIHLPESFDYPRENSDIRLGHLRFDEWAKSYGFSYMDWYRVQNGYRNTNHIYLRR